MAWLHAVPKPHEGTKRAKSGVTPTLSRFDQMKRDGIAPQMPPNPMPNIIARLVEIGMTQAGGMGPAPLSWSEIDAWRRITGIGISPMEGRLLRDLSIAYLGEMGRADSENCPPPWKGEVTSREIELETARLRAVLG